MTQVQHLASSAVQWCEQKGGVVEKDDLVNRISSLGSSGKHAKNCERDFHFLLRSLARRLGVKINTVQARLYSHTSASIEWQPISVIFPDDMAKALFAKGSSVWHHTMFGNHSPEEVESFWSHCKETCDWFKGSQYHNYPLLRKLIPMSFYGDDIAAYKGSETGSVTVLGWCSDLGYQNPSLTRYFPIAVYPEYAATEFTYDDIMGHVVARTRDMVDPTMFFDWSDGGYAFMLSSLQGDLKFIVEHYGLHNYRSNLCCSLCGVKKKANDGNLSMTLGDFRENADHASSLPDLSEFHERGSIVFSLGIPLDRVLHDCLHSQLLGTGKTANASAIVYLAEVGYWGAFPRGLYSDSLALVLRQAHLHFLRWKKQHGLQASQPRFTPARLGRKTRMQYPVLSSKGIPSKVVTFWVAHCCVEHAARPEATELDRLVATCLHSYASSLKNMDTSGLVLSEEQAESYYQDVIRHLQTYAALNSKSRMARGKQANRTLWLMICKHHHYYHHCKTVRIERINPRISQLLAAEDFVGRVGKIARATHKGNVPLRTLERYLALVNLELAKLD